MKKVSSKTKKIVAIFLVVLILASAITSNLTNVFADQTDSSDYEALEGLENLGQSDMLAAPLGMSIAPFSATDTATITNFKINNQSGTVKHVTNYKNISPISFYVAFNTGTIDARGGSIRVEVPENSKGYYILDSVGDVEISELSKQALGDKIDFASVDIKTDGSGKYINFPFFNDREVKVSAADINFSIKFNADQYNGMLPPNTNIGVFKVKAVSQDGSKESTPMSIDVVSFTEDRRVVINPLFLVPYDTVSQTHSTMPDTPIASQLRFWTGGTIRDNELWKFHPDHDDVFVEMKVPKKVEAIAVNTSVTVDTTSSTEYNIYKTVLKAHDISTAGNWERPDQEYAYKGIVFKVPLVNLDPLKEYEDFAFVSTARYYLAGSDVEQVKEITNTIRVYQPNATNGKISDSAIQTYANSSQNTYSVYVNPTKTFSSTIASNNNSNMSYGGMQNIGTGPVKNAKIVWTNDDPKGIAIILLRVGGLSGQKYKIEMFDSTYNTDNTVAPIFSKITNIEYFATGMPVIGVSRIEITPITDDLGTVAELNALTNLNLSIHISGDGRSSFTKDETYNTTFDFTWDEYNGTGYEQKSKSGENVKIIYRGKVLNIDTTITPAASAGPGDNVALSFKSVINQKIGTTVDSIWEKPVLYFAMPNELEWDPNQTITIKSAGGGVLETISASQAVLLTDKIEGKPVYKLELNNDYNLVPDTTSAGTITYDIQFKVKAGTQSGNVTVNRFAFLVDAKDYGNAYNDSSINALYAGQLVSNNPPIDGITADYIRSAAPFTLSVQSGRAFASYAELKPTPTSAWTTNGSNVASTVLVNDSGDFRLIMKNSGNIDVKEFKMYGLFGSKTVNSAVDGSTLAAASKWDAVLSDIKIQVTDRNGITSSLTGSKVRYANSYNPQIPAYESVFAGRTGEAATWQDYLHGTTPLADVKSIQFDLGTATMKPGDTVTITAEILAPSDTGGGALIGTRTYNSFISFGKYTDNMVFSTPMEMARLILQENGDASISGTVFKANDKTNQTTSGLQDIEVELYATSDLTSYIATTTTNSSGVYSFNNLYANTYKLKFIAPSGSPVTRLVDNGIAGNLTLTGGFSDDISLPTGTDVTSKNTGLYRLGSVKVVLQEQGETDREISYLSNSPIGTTGTVKPGVTPGVDLPANKRIKGTDTKSYNITWESPNVVLTFEIEPDLHEVKFNSKGGSAVASIFVPHNQSIIGSGQAMPEDPTRSGYKFSGWVTTDGGTVEYTGNEITTAPTEVFASWTQVWKVTFDSKGGTPVDPVLVIAGKNIQTTPNVSMPASPTKTNYRFMGWLMPDGTTAFDAFTTINSDITVTARWKEEFKVNFDTDGGTPSSIPSLTILDGDSIESTSGVSMPANPVKSGYKFRGWAIDGSTTPNFNKDSIVSKTINAKAVWSQYYTVSFDTTGGSPSTINPLQVADGDSISTDPLTVMPADPTKTGYSFAGWSKDGSMVNNFTATTVITSNTSVKALWTQEHTISFDTQGGTPSTVPSFVVLNNKSISETPGKALPTATQVTKTNYVLAGWSEDKDADPYTFTVFSDTTPILKTTKLFAIWKLQDRKVTFDSNGGSTLDVTLATVPHGKKIADVAGEKLPTDPTRPGYKFAGWVKTNASAQVPDFTENTMVTADVTVYAVWLKLHTVKFNTKGGSAISDVFVPNTQSVKNNTNNVSMPADPTKTDYKFNKWVTTDGGSTEFTGNEAITADKEVFADWTKIHTVSFDTDGGTPSAIGSIKVLDGKSISVTDNANMPGDPTKTNFDFSGWAIDGDKNKPFDSTTIITTDTTVKALWTEKFVVKFNYNDNTGKIVYVEVLDNKTIQTTQGSVMLVDPTRENYNFKGWAVGNPNATIGDFDKNTVVTASIEVYAAWTLKPRTVTFNPNGGSDVSPSNVIVPHGKTIAETSGVSMPGDSVRSGYKFEGWSVNKNATFADFNENTAVNGDTTVYAVWRKIHTVTFNPNGGTISGKNNIEVLNGMSIDEIVGETMPTASGKVGHNFVGWAKTADATAADFTGSTKITGDITVYAYWEVIKFDIEVRHYTYNYNETKANAVEIPNSVVKEKVSYGTDYTASKLNLEKYNFIAEDLSDITIKGITSQPLQPIKLYYKHIEYKVSSKQQVELAVDDKHPLKVNKPSFEKFLELIDFEITSNKVDSKLKAAIVKNKDATITSDNYDLIDFSKVTKDYDYKANINVVWDSGQTYNQEVEIKITDTVQPTIKNSTLIQTYYFFADAQHPNTEAELYDYMVKNGLEVSDNYDENPEVKFTYVDGSFNNINWKKSGAYGYYIEATDSSGNLSKKVAYILHVIAFDGKDDSGNSGNGTNRPDTDVNGGTGNGSSPGANGSNNGAGSNSTNRDGDIVYSDGTRLTPEGKLISADGQVISLDSSVSGRLPKTGAVVVGTVSILGLLMLVLFLIMLAKRKKKDEEKI